MIIAWLLGAALSASAHDLYPIRPVQAVLRVEPDRIVADLRADSIVWIEEVTGLHPMPASGWPPETRAKVEGYVNAHFRLAAGGTPLAGKLIEARYRQLPWEVNEEGVFFLRLVYPPAPAGAALEGAASFYAEYRKELESELGGRPLPFKEGYRTVVDVPGRRRASFTLTPEAPSFTVPADDARRTRAAMLAEALGRGASGALGAAAAFPAVLGIAIWLGALGRGRGVRAALAAVAAVSAARGAAFGSSAWEPWAGALAGALAAGGWLGRAGAAAAAAAAAWAGSSWGGEAAPRLPHAAGAAAAAALGALAGGGALLAAAWLGVRAEHRRLFDISESRVDVLYVRRARLAATILIMVGAYGLWQSQQR